MKPGEASATAQRVAAHRLAFARVAAPFGDPAADERLARDVAGPAASRPPSGPMVRYLAARTAFFDRQVVDSVQAGVGQVVVAAAGYDGRSLRYGTPSVRWFEVDHPDTQRDKRARLDRLDIDTSAITFVACDFTVDDVHASLAGAGLDSTLGSLVLCEGIAAYLDRAVLESLLRGLRDAVGPDSRLAISLSTGAKPERRARFQAAVASMGEPAGPALTAADAWEVLGSTGWHPPVVDEADDTATRRARVGFLAVDAA